MPEIADITEMTEQLRKVSEQSQSLVQDFVERQSRGEQVFQGGDPTSLVRGFSDLTARMMAEPQRILELQGKFWNDYMSLWQTTAQKMMGQSADDVIEPAKGDRRFKGEDWNNNPPFDHIKQAYLLASKFTLEAVRQTDGLEEKTAEKVEFYTRQFIDALAPTNFLATNPEVIRETVETGGANLLKGLSNLLDDLERGKGRLRIKMTDLDRFKLGENVAVSKGAVVFQNDLMQLLQFSPTTEQVFKRPLLIMPPWINKYYILDLRESNSFIKWAVDQGHTVFVISWVNPDERLSDKSFEDYIVEGPLAALDAIEAATGERDVKAIGYCIGGTLLAATLAYMAKVGDERIKTATFFTTMVEFSKPGELGVFIDDEQIRSLEQQMDEKGYMEGATMAEVFNMLRASDLIWSFVINNYLMGKDPFPFDLLYWNSDSTRMPKVMHSYYLREMYQRNLLAQPGGLKLLGESIDLRDINIPVYILSTLEDHIAPWKATYAATQMYQGKVRFVLGKSGHIAGVVNPPDANKYGYWVGKEGEYPEDPEEWHATVGEARDGSWWNDWNSWNRRYSRQMVAAREPGDGELKVIELAPGSYVKMKA
tara:strand:- start:817 stop:2601 length:1785 start_codon:yes stop_codon:yes gene_type:complete